MTGSPIIALLRTKTSLFAGFTDERLESVVSGSQVASFEANEVVQHSGEEASQLGVVLEGTVAASIGTDDGSRHVLGRFSPGDTFGEMALMIGRRLRAAHEEQPFFARTPVVTISGSVDAFRLKLWDEEHGALVGFPPRRGRQRAPTGDAAGATISA